MFEPLTKRQKEILDFIKNFNTENGYSPSLEEVRKSFKLKAISTVHEHIQNLQKKGYLKKEINQARGISIKSMSDYEGNCIKVEILGNFEDSKKLNSNHSLKEILISKNLLNIKKEYFGLVVSKEISDNFKEKDILIFEKANKSVNGKLHLITISNKKELLIRTVENQKYRFKLTSPNLKIKDRFEKNISVIGRLALKIVSYN